MIFVSVGGKQVQTQSTVHFASTVDDTAPKSLDLIVGNQGDARLKIRDIRLAPNGNKYITMDPVFVAADFPKYVIASDIGGDTSILAKIRCSPGAPPDNTPTTLTIEYTDVTDGTFTLTIMPVKRAPQIKVTPDIYTFVGATAAVPQTQDFVISNTGNDTLTLLAPLSFAVATNAFIIINGPKVGTKIDPEGTGLGHDSVTFTVRYAPDIPPDENYIIIKSDDPADGEKLVKLQGEMDLGAAQITWTDQVTTGCIDFTKQAPLGDTCTKVVSILNIGKGELILKMPTIVPAGSTAYTFQWFHGGGSQAAACGPYNGTEIDSTQSQYVLTAGSSVDVAVTYVAPGAAGQNASLVLDYLTPYTGTFEVPLCGGAPKGVFDIASSTGKSMTFFAGPLETKQKTLVIMNKGNGPLLVHGVTFSKANASDPDGVFLVKTPVSEVTVAPFALLPVTIQFSTKPGFAEPIVHGQVAISYQDPLTASNVTALVNVVGHNNDFEGIILPVAWVTPIPKTPKAGQQLLLDGSASTGGTFAPWNDGLTWFVSAKPAGSLVFLNRVGLAEVSLTLDVVGTYEFRVIPVSTDGTSTFYYGDEMVVTVQVSQ